mgnify:CR=1 FL=1|jgi:hypothetical protein
MKVTVDKAVLYEFLEKISENYLSSGDDLDKFEFEDEPIKAVSLMSTQLSQEEPDVADPDYRPASVEGLSAAASVIAKEVPTNMVDEFYKGLHRLLDRVYDEHRDKEMQAESRVLNESPNDDIASALVGAFLDHKRKIINKVQSLKDMGMSESEIQQYKNSLGFIFNEPQDDVQKMQQSIDLITFSIRDNPDLRAQLRGFIRDTGTSSAAAKNQIAQMIASLDTSKPAAHTANNDNAIYEYAQQIFGSILMSLDIDETMMGQIDVDQQTKILEAVSETVAKLLSMSTVSISNVAGVSAPIEVNSQDVASILQMEAQKFLGDLGLTDSGSGDIEDYEEVIDQPQAIEDEKKTFTDLAGFLGFSGASGARQWYKKHIENKFLMLVKTMRDKSKAGSGTLSFYQVYSDTYKLIVQKMAQLMGEFERMYDLPAGSIYELAMQKFEHDLSNLSKLVEPMEHILDSTDGCDALIAVMNSHVGNAVAGANSDAMKQITTYIMDKASPIIAESVLSELYPNITPVQSKKLQEHISGKSNRPFEESEKDNSLKKYTLTTKKFIKLGIDKEGYKKIVSDYLKELDVALESALLSPDKVQELYGAKAADMMKKLPEMTAIFKKVSKKANLKDSAILDMMEQTLIEYATDERIKCNTKIQERKLHNLKELAKIIGACL